MEDIWGIGRRQAVKLAVAGITNAWQLAQADDVWLRKNLTVTGWNTALELRGIPAITEGEEPAPRKSVLSSHSFGKKVENREALAEALASFTARAAERMRRSGMCARGVSVHIRTSCFDQQHQYEQTGQHAFQVGTNDTGLLQREALRILSGIYTPDFAYAKAGVMLYGLKPQGRQGSLLPMPEANPRRMALMAALDTINAKHGMGSLRFGAEGLAGQVWKMRQNNASSRFTTKRDALDIAKWNQV